jgi:pilus assembly protein Flp/PilA
MLEFIRSTTRRRDEVGASAVEYGLLIAGIAGMVVAIVFAFGPVVKNSFQGTCNRLKQGSTSTAQTC